MIWLSGFLTGISLIFAIGAQNAFVLRQGLRREYVGLVVSICAASDALLILIGTSFLGTVLPTIPVLSYIMKFAGAAFLAIYGSLRLWDAWIRNSSLVVQEHRTISAWAVAAHCLALTWLNPHVYLDTILLLGSISAQYSPFENLFGWGAASASLIFFIILGYGARFLAPLFLRRHTWVILDVAIGVLMWGLALNLILG
jgi:L-lysine exporter family protein LysE/ArgO